MHTHFQAYTHTLPDILGRPQVSRLLIMGGASVTWRTEVIGRAPVLGVHAHLGHMEEAGLLLEMGAAVDAVSDTGMTQIGRAHV